jgi:hypothetical protein
MFINNSVGYDANMNVLEAIHIFSAAKKASSAATIVHCFHKTGIIPQEECKIESGIDVVMVINWQHLCQKLDAEAEFNSFICVDDDVIATPEVTWESGDDLTLVDEEDDDDDENSITVMQNPVWRDVSGAS